MSSDRYGSDAELVEGLRRGEDAAATAFVRKYLPLIRAGLRRYMDPYGEFSEPRDLEDESIVLAERLIREVAGTRPVTNLRALVAVSASNAGRDWYRRTQRELERDGGTESANVAPEQLDVDARNDEEVRAAHYVPINPAAATALEQARQVLKSWELDLLDLHARGYSYEEIAFVLRNDTKPVKEASWRQRRKRANDRIVSECRRLAGGDPKVLHALEEGQRLIRERRKAGSPKEDS